MTWLMVGLNVFGVLFIASIIATVKLAEHLNHDGILGFSFFMDVVSSIGVVVMIVLCILCYGAGVKADVYNRTFGTQISREQMFFAGEETKEILRQQMQTIKQRYEITIPEKMLEMVE